MAPMNTLRSLLLAISLPLAVGACGGAAPANEPATPKTEPGKASPEARAALLKTYQQQFGLCDKNVTEMDTKLAAALEKLSGGAKDATGKPAPSIGDAVAKLAKEKVTISLDVLGSPEMPMLMLKDSTMEEGQKLAGAPPAKLQAFAKRMTAVQPSLNTLREATQAVNGALGASFQTAIQCTMYAKAFTTQLGAMANADDPPTPELLQEYAKFLQANARAKATASGSIALMGALQAGFAGKDPKALDTLLAAVKEMKDKPEVVTEDLAKKTYEAAGQALFDACHEQMEKTYREHPELQRPAVDPCSKEGSKVRGAPGSDKPAAAAGGGMDDLVGDVVKRLVPRDTPMADATDALLALKKGDYLSVLKGAAKLVGRVTPLGGAINTVLGIFK
jgi:hypothetical protein